jgi:hypothetical protein
MIRRVLLPVVRLSMAAAVGAVLYADTSAARRSTSTSAPQQPAAASPRSAVTPFSELVVRLSEPGGYFNTDNLISNEVWSGDGDEEVIARAQSLRSRGWELEALHPLRGQGPAGWPPRDATFSIELDEADLAFIRAQVDAAVASTTRLLSSEQLHTHVRADQELSLTFLEGARAELAGVTHL